MSLVRRNGLLAIWISNLGYTQLPLIGSDSQSYPNQMGSRSRGVEKCIYWQQRGCGIGLAAHIRRSALILRINHNILYLLLMMSTI